MYNASPRFTACTCSALALALTFTASPAHAADEVSEEQGVETVAADDSAFETRKAAPQPPQGGSAGQQPGLEDLQFLQALQNSVFARDNITLGIGAGIIPSYEGSDNYVLFPAPQIRGQVSGFQFSSPGGGPGIAVDLIRDKPLSQTEIIAGPLIRVNLNRAIQSQINDPVVELLGDLDAAVEVGAQFGVRFNNIDARLDSLTIQTNIAFDVAGAHSGTIITPSVSYNRPIGTDKFVQFTLSADWVDNDYADFYYGVSAAGAAASGLPVFDADSGVKALSFSVLGGLDLNGNALDGGWALFGLLGYSRLTDSAEDTPITDLRGDANQFIGALGIAYTF